MESLGRFFASPGMSSEGFTLLRASELERVGDGGGVPGEEIEVHRVRLAEMLAFVERKRSEGAAIDVKLLLLLSADLLTGA